MKYFFGLAADPLTIGHIAIIKAIHKQLKNNDELYIAISNNDEKQYHATLDERFSIVHDAIMDKFKKNPPILLKQDKRTLAFLTENFAGQEKEIVICVGEDEWKSLLEGRWVNYDLILKRYQFLVVGRQNTEIKTCGYPVTVVNIQDCTDVSSSAVRDILYRNPNCHYCDVEKHITHQTFRSIKENRLYKQNDFDYQKQEAEFLEKYEKQKFKNAIRIALNELKEEGHCDDATITRIEEVLKHAYGEPSATTDIIAYNGDDILLIRRKKAPYANYWAVPGGFFEKTDKDLCYGAARELREETGLTLDPEKFEQIKAYGHDFDPRMKIVDTAFCIRVPKKMMSIAAGADDAAEARWFKLDNLPTLAFHHKQIIEDFIKMKNIEI